MALQFNPYPLEPYLNKIKSEQDNAAMVPNAIAGGITNAFNAFMQAKEQQKQNQLRQLQMKRLGQEIDLADQENQPLPASLFGQPQVTQQQPDMSFARPMLQQNPLSAGPSWSGKFNQYVETKQMQPRGNDDLLSKISGLTGVQQKRALESLKIVGEFEKNTRENKEFEKKLKNGSFNFDDETKLRNEFVNASKQFSDVSQSFQRIKDSVANPSAAGDLALIFNYMKMLDPGSTVREGEFATAQNSAGIPQRIQAQYNKVISGERLADAQRADFFSRSKSLYQGQKSLHDNRVNEYSRIAKSYNLDPQRIIVGINAGDTGIDLPSSGSGVSDGTVKEIGGISYIKRGGQWYPQ